jgi:hypothetical protein
MASTPALGVRDEFVNTTEGWIGAVKIGPHGEQRGMAIGPHGNVWLSEDEQILTANAPRADADNPFLERTIPPEEPGGLVTKLPPLLQLRTKGVEIKSRRPFGADAQEPEQPDEAEQEETGAAPLPEGEPAEGTRPAEEEVATPNVVPEGKRRRKAATA